MNEHLEDFDRAGRITASIVGAILRHDPYHSQKWAWRVITGREPERAPNMEMKRGIEHEDDAIESLEIELGLLAKPGRFVRHPVLEYLGSSPDAWIMDSVSGLVVPVEAKCPRLLHAEIPLHYYDQVQTQLECCDAPVGFFVSWVNDHQQVWRVERDGKWWAETEPLLKSFWDDYIVPDVEPPRAPRRSKCVKDTQANLARSSLKTEPLKASCP